MCALLAIVNGMSGGLFLDQEHDGSERVVGASVVRQ